MREPPKDLDSERVVIAGILTGGARALAEIADILKPEHMAHPAHEAILTACLELDAQAKPIDYLTVQAHMKARGMFGKLVYQGGADFLHGLSRHIVSPEHIKHHARQVRDTATVRAIILAASSIVDLGYKQALPLGDLLAESQRLILEACGEIGRRQAQPVKALLRESLKALEERYNRRGQLTGLPTGFEVIDAFLSGLVGGRLYLLGARPGMGKTSLAWQIAVRCGAPVYVFSLEMGGRDLADRAIIQEAQIDGLRYAHGTLETSDWIRASRAVSDLSDLPILVDDSEALTLAELRAKLLRWRASFQGPGLVVLDYLQLMQGKPSRDSTREREIGEISRGIKCLAKELDLPIIALSQLNRGLESRADKRPVSSDLRDSGQLEQDADAILFLYRDEVYNPETEKPGIAEVIVSKNRFGPKGTVEVQFKAKSMRFE